MFRFVIHDISSYIERFLGEGRMSAVTENENRVTGKYLFMCFVFGTPPQVNDFPKTSLTCSKSVSEKPKQRNVYTEQRESEIVAIFFNPCDEFFHFRPPGFGTSTNPQHTIT